MFNKIYEKIKKFIIKNYIGLIIIGIVMFLCFFQLPYVIYTPGGIIPLESRIKIADGYESEGSLNMSYVSMVKGTIPLLLVSYIVPNWDIVPKSNIIYNNESIDELMEYERLQMRASIANATLVAYQKVGKDITISNRTLNIITTTKKAKTDVKKMDQLLTLDGEEISNIEDIRTIIQNHEVGDTVKLEVLRKGNKKECSAVIYDEEDTKLMGISFLEVYDYETNPKIEVKTKNSEAGSSGGLMMSLAIYNALTENDITKGKKIVGTGTISSDGTVGPIDGVKYKLLGAVNNKAAMFICPKENYNEAIKYKNALNLKIDIYGVSSFDEALSIIEN